MRGFKQRLVGYSAVVGSSLKTFYSFTVVLNLCKVLNQLPLMKLPSTLKSKKCSALLYYHEN
jgi:hypothetical protein